MKLFPLMMTAVIGVVTIAPLGASAKSYEDDYTARIPLITKYEDGYSEPYDPPSGTIQCISKPSGGSLKNRLLRSLGGTIGELRGIVNADARTDRKILGWEMKFQNITPAEFDISDDSSNFALRYESNLKRRLKNTSGLPGGRSRESGGQAWVGLNRLGATVFRMRFHGGAVYDSRMGLIRMFRAEDEATTFDFDCPIGIGRS